MTRQSYVLTVQIEGSHHEVQDEHRVVMQALNKAKRFIELNGQGSKVTTNIRYFDPNVTAQLYRDVQRTVKEIWGISKGPLKEGLTLAKDELVKAIKDAW